jgi:Aminoacyl tRNA synthetase class II, N-terminal domain
MSPHASRNATGRPRVVSSSACPETWRQQHDTAGTGGRSCSWRITRVKYLGKRGALTQLLRAQRPVVRREANEAKARIESELEARLTALEGV